MAGKSHQLMKKHSQTDLVSRLKTRKVLGVGEDGQAGGLQLVFTPRRRLVERGGLDANHGLGHLQGGRWRGARHRGEAEMEEGGGGGQR